MSNDKDPNLNRQDSNGKDLRIKDVASPIKDDASPIKDVASPSPMIDGASSTLNDCHTHQADSAVSCDALDALDAAHAAHAPHAPHAHGVADICAPVEWSSLGATEASAPTDLDLSAPFVEEGGQGGQGGAAGQRMEEQREEQHDEQRELTQVEQQDCKGQRHSSGAHHPCHVSWCGEESRCSPTFVVYEPSESEAVAIGVALQGVDEWAWKMDILQQASASHSLQVLGWHLLCRWGLVEEFALDQTATRRWLAYIEGCYVQTPYHNSMHAADVTQTVHFFLSSGGLAAFLDTFEILGVSCVWLLVMFGVLSCLVSCHVWCLVMFGVLSCCLSCRVPSLVLFRCLVMCHSV